MLEVVDLLSGTEFTLPEAPELKRIWHLGYFLVTALNKYLQEYLVAGRFKISTDNNLPVQEEET